MLVAKRVYAAVFAGILAAGLAAGSPALAAEGGSLLQGIAEGAAAAVEESAASEASGEDLAASGDPAAPGTSNLPAAPDDSGSGLAGDLALADLGSFATVVQGPVSYQVLDGWTATDLSDSEVSCYYFEDAAGMFECIVSPEGATGMEDEFAAEYLAYIDEEVGGATFEDPVDRYLDGALVRDVSFSTVQEGLTFRGVVTFMFGSDCTVVAESVFVYGDGYDPSGSYIQVHRSLGWTAPVMRLVG